MHWLCVLLGLLLAFDAVRSDVGRPPRFMEKNVHKSHITHHNLNTEEAERRRKAESDWYPTEDSCAKTLNVPKVCRPGERVLVVTTRTRLPDV